MTETEKIKRALVILRRLRPYLKDQHDTRRVLLAAAIKALS
jgi:hypothetical protein